MVYRDGQGVRMVGRKEVGVKRGDERRELISVECERHGQLWAAKALHG